MGLDRHEVGPLKLLPGKNMNKIYLLLILLLLCCHPESAKEYPQNPEPGIWSPGNSQWVAHYQKSDHLQAQPENPNVLISSEGDLRLRLEKLPDQSNLAALRETAFKQLSCQDGFQHDAYINCSLGFQKLEQQFGAHSALSLIYFGNLQSPNSPNTLLFLQLNGNSVKVEIEGDTTPYLDDLTKLFDTLSFKLEALNSQDTDQKGL